MRHHTYIPLIIHTTLITACTPCGIIHTQKPHLPHLIRESSFNITFLPTRTHVHTFVRTCPPPNRDPSAFAPPPLKRHGTSSPPPFFTTVATGCAASEEGTLKWGLGAWSATRAPEYTKSKKLRACPTAACPNSCLVVLTPERCMGYVCFFSCLCVVVCVRVCACVCVRLLCICVCACVCVCVACPAFAGNASV